jgi:chromosome segregation ATPase
MSSESEVAALKLEKEQLEESRASLQQELSRIERHLKSIDKALLRKCEHNWAQCRLYIDCPYEGMTTYCYKCGLAHTVGR